MATRLWSSSHYLEDFTYDSDDPGAGDNGDIGHSIEELIGLLGASPSSPSCPCVKYQHGVCSRFVEWFSHSKGQMFPINKYIDLTQQETHFQNSIDLDITRTFPRDAFITEHDNLAKLQRILYAYAAFDEEVGYVQGMNFICGFMLYHSGSEINTFSLLRNLMMNHRIGGSPTHLSLRRLFLPGHAGLKMWCFVVQQILFEEAPDVFAHLLHLATESEQTFPQDMFLVLFADIFLTIFTSSAPFLPVTRVWDLFFAHGWLFLCRLCVSFILTERKAILQADALEIVMSLMKSNAMLKSNQLNRRREESKPWRNTRVANRKWFSLITAALSSLLLSRDRQLREVVKTTPVKICGHSVEDDYFEPTVQT